MTMQPWFNEAKLGIFVHYGIYSVDGVPESWALFDQVVPHEQYMRQLDGFTAAAFDPSAWAGLFARAGAGYAVLTARHHDGVALWETRLSDLSVVGRTPAGRDLVAEYVSAMRDRGLRAGLYYSHSDWNHPDYASVRHPRPPHPELVDSPYVSPAPGARTRGPGSATSTTGTARCASCSPGSDRICSGSTASGSARPSSGGCPNWRG